MSIGKSNTDLTPRSSATIHIAPPCQKASSPEVDGFTIDDKKYTPVEIDPVKIPKSPNHLSNNTECPNATEGTTKYADCIPIFDITRKSRLVKINQYHAHSTSKMKSFVHITALLISSICFMISVGVISDLVKRIIWSLIQQMNRPIAASLQLGIVKNIDFIKEMSASNI